MYYVKISGEELQQIAEANSSDLPGPSASDAIALARSLMGAYRASDYQDAKVFSGLLCELFRAYPREHGMAIISPVDGLPSRLKFSPSLAEVREALQALTDQRRKLVNRATGEIKNRERERLEQERHAQFEVMREANRVEREGSE